MCVLVANYAEGPHDYQSHPRWYHRHCQMPSHGELQRLTQRAIDVFMVSRRPNGNIDGLEWWQTANAYTAIALHDLWSGQQTNYQMLDDCIKKCDLTNKGLINEFNDDTLWWAMCCLHMHQLRGDQWYLSTAKNIWRHIRDSGSVCSRGQLKVKGWDMEGGCYWTTRPEEDQINSVSTGLYAELSVRLALLEGADGDHGDVGSSFRGKWTDVRRSDLIEAARRSIGWIIRCRYRPDDAIVLDGFRTKKNESVDWTFTYNTGICIGVCTLLYRALNEEEYLLLACHMAEKAMYRPSWVEEDGVLTERGAYGYGTHSALENNDAVGFKSVLFRRLCMLYDTIAGMRDDSPKLQKEKNTDLIRRFLLLNFESQITCNTNGHDQYGPWWDGPRDVPTSHSQMAVLDVMAGAHLATRKTIQNANQND